MKSTELRIILVLFVTLHLTIDVGSDIFVRAAMGTRRKVKEIQNPRHHIDRQSLFCYSGGNEMNDRESQP